MSIYIFIYTHTHKLIGSILWPPLSCFALQWNERSRTFLTNNWISCWRKSSSRVCPNKCAILKTAANKHLHLQKSVITTPTHSCLYIYIHTWVSVFICGPSCSHSAAKCLTFCSVYITSQMQWMKLTLHQLIENISCQLVMAVGQILENCVVWHLITEWSSHR